MENLFESAVTAEIISRIQQLQSSSQPKWGKMNVAQMLAHCQAPIEAGLSDKKLKQAFIGKIFGNIAKKGFLKDKPFGKNLPTDKSFIIKDEKNFEEEKNKLIRLIKRFAAGGPSAVTKEPHPFFGKMTQDEWSLITWKHLDHHLQQFGV